MSLATLLAAGKSLVGVKNDDSPYRLTQEAYLPKFTLDTGTRRTVATTRGETFAGGLGATESSEATARTPQEPIANGAKEAEIAKSKEIPERRASGAAAPGARSGWLWKVAAIFGRPKSKTPPRLPLMTRRQVQCELSLEDVKVVRNDLRDADVAIVRLRSSAAPADALPLSLRRGQTGASATFLGRATGRFFASR